MHQQPELEARIGDIRLKTETRTFTDEIVDLPPISAVLVAIYNDTYVIETFTIIQQSRQLDIYHAILFPAHICYDCQNLVEIRNEICIIYCFWTFQSDLSTYLHPLLISNIDGIQQHSTNQIDMIMTGLHRPHITIQEIDYAQRVTYPGITDIALKRNHFHK